MLYQCPVCKKAFEEEKWEAQSNKYQATIAAVYGYGARAVCCPKCTSVFPANRAKKVETDEV